MTADPDWEFGDYDGICAGCDLPGRVDTTGLCQHCGPMLERDVIRSRDWDYSVSAYGMSGAEREALRRRVVGRFGEGFELIAPPRRAVGRKRTRRKRR